MRLRHIEVFHAVMQAGSLSGAAALLHISQPAASKMLAQAEQSLGVELFKRLPSGLKPTPEATLLFQETKTLHQSLERVRHLARNLSAHPGGLLRVGCIPSLGLGLVPRVIASFMKQCPDVSINIRTENNETLAALLLAQEIDVAVAFEPPVTPGITIEELGRARAVLFDSRTHDIEETMVQLSDLDFPNWIALDPEDPLGARVSAAVAVMGRELTPMIEVKTYYLARALVESGVGFTIIDEYTAYSHAGDHRNVVPVEPEVSVGVCLMTSASNASSQALRVLVEQLTRELAKHGTRSTPG